MSRSSQRKKDQERLAKLEKDTANPARTQFRGAMVHAEYRYSGILPLPEHLQAYEALHPGITERFMALGERQSTHRQGLERRFLNFNGWSQIAGVFFAGIIVLAAIGSGTYLLLQDKNVEGYVSMFTPLGIIAAVFFSTRQSWRKERDRKQQAEQG